MKRIVLVVLIFISLTPLLCASYAETKALLYEEDMIMLVNSAVYNKTGRRRRYQNIVQRVEYLHYSNETTDILSMNYAPKDSTGIAWLYSDNSTLCYDPIYDEFTGEILFPSYLLSILPPEYALFKIISESDNSIILVNDSYTIEYRLENKLPVEKTITEHSSGKIILKSSLSDYKEIDENLFYPMFEVRWFQHFNGVEIENTIQDIQLKEIPESYFSKEFIRAKVN